MKKIKEYISNIYNKAKDNIVVRYVFALGVLSLFSIMCVRPVIHNFAYNESVTVSAAKKKLPIYCVQTDEKKVAISFDAAWGAYRLRSNSIKTEKAMNSTVYKGS